MKGYQKMSRFIEREAVKPAMPSPNLSLQVWDFFLSFRSTTHSLITYLFIFRQPMEEEPSFQLRPSEKFSLSQHTPMIQRYYFPSPQPDPHSQPPHFLLSLSFSGLSSCLSQPNAIPLLHWRNSYSPLLTSYPLVPSSYFLFLFFFSGPLSSSCRDH